MIVLIKVRQLESVLLQVIYHHSKKNRGNWGGGGRTFAFKLWIYLLFLCRACLEELCTFHLRQHPLGLLWRELFANVRGLFNLTHIIFFNTMCTLITLVLLLELMRQRDHMQQVQRKPMPICAENATRTVEHPIQNRKKWSGKIKKHSNYIKLLFKIFSFL